MSFFSSRKDTVPTFLRTALAVGVVILCLGGFGIFQFLRSRSVIDQLVRERLRDQAALAALQFSGEEVESIRSADDVQKPFFQKMYRRLNEIRHMPGVISVYILRRTNTPETLEFVIDADLFSPFEELDQNKSGAIDTWEASAQVGERYRIDDVPALQENAFIGPTTDEEVTHDKWGDTISGYAPIRREDGTAVATLGIDMSAAEYLSLRRSAFSMQSLLVLFVAIGVIASFVLMTFWKLKMQELRSLDDERTWLLQLILHQVGSPLTIFKWGLESLRDSLRRIPGTESEEVKENLTMMEDGVTRLQHVNDVLITADRIQNGSMIIQRETLSLNLIIEEVVASVKSQLERRNQKVRVKIPEDMHLELDHQLLAGVLRELLDNAVIYSNTGGIIEVRARKHGEFAEVQVVDTGAGIPKHDLSRMFERFVRGSNASQFDPNGVGMGLYLAQGIIERFGGTIDVQSVEGKGTTVTFTLPLK